MPIRESDASRCVEAIESFGARYPQLSAGAGAGAGARSAGAGASGSPPQPIRFERLPRFADLKQVPFVPVSYYEFRIFLMF